MDPTSARESLEELRTRGVQPDINKVETLADPNCNKCYGRGIKGTLIVYKGPSKKLLCNCVVKFLKKHPALSFAFLKAHGGTH